MKRFEGQIALVTGAAQGVGRATAKRLVGEGAVLVLVDRAVEHGQAVAEEIRAQGGQASFIDADLETHAGAQRMVQYALDQHGRIDVSVHNSPLRKWRFSPPGV